MINNASFFELTKIKISMILKFILFMNLVFLVHYSYACTTILIGKEATKNRCVILAHNEDMGKEAAGVLTYYTGQKFPSKTLLKVPYIELDQVLKTYSFWGAGNAKNVSGLGVSNQLAYEYNHILVGMNENGVAIASNWMNSKEENLVGVGIRRYAIRQLVLERAKTSKEAVEIITNFIDKYGQADWSGLTYSVADSNEAWVIETTSSHWVARRIRDNEIWTVANRFTITDDYDIASSGLVKYAYNKKWISTEREKINFRKVFGKFPENAQEYDIGRENLVRNLLGPHKEEIEVAMVMEVLKYRYQDEENFKPITEECWRDYCIEHKLKRPLSSCLTQSSIIATLHPKYEKLGGKMWYSHASPHVGIYFPIYGVLTKIYSGFGNEEAKSLNWWKFRQLQARVDNNYDSLFMEFNNFQEKIQNQILVENSKFESKNEQDLAEWEKHQEKLSEMAMEILTEN